MRVLIGLCLLGTLPWSALGKEPSLWPLQQQLVGKRLVDLTHAFAPGIPHWPGFPNEKRQTIYWYNKKPGMMGDGFFAEVFTMSGSGARMLIHRRISKKADARSIKSRSKK